MKRKRKKTKRSVLLDLRVENQKLLNERKDLFERLAQMSAVLVSVVVSADQLRDYLTSLPGYNSGMPKLRAHPIPLDEMFKTFGRVG